MSSLLSTPVIVKRPLLRPWTIRGTTKTSDIADERLRQSADNFFVFQRKLRELTGLLRTHHSNTVKLRTSRANLAHLIGSMSMESPIASLISAPVETDENNGISNTHCAESCMKNDDGESDQKEQQERQQQCDLLNAAVDFFSPQQEEAFQMPAPYQAIHSQSAKRMANIELLQKEMIDYSTQWDQVVTSRVCAELRMVKKLQSNLASYEHKVDSLQASVAKKKRKEKPVDLTKSLSKVSRNEAKLRRAKKEYRNGLILTTLLVEEMTLRGWKDLVPLLMKLLQNDVDFAKESASLLPSFSLLLEELQGVCRRFDMSDDAISNGRMKLLLEEDAIDFARQEDMDDIGSLEPFTVEPTIGGTISITADEGVLDDVQPSDSARSSPQVSDDFNMEAAENVTNSSKNKEEAGENADADPVEPRPPNFQNVIGERYLPSSFYIEYNDGDHHEDDDLTTLTPYTRCERRISI